MAAHLGIPGIKHKFKDLAGIISDVQHGDKTDIPDAHHEEVHSLGSHSGELLWSMIVDCLIEDSIYVIKNRRLRVRENADSYAELRAYDLTFPFPIHEALVRLYSGGATPRTYDIKNTSSDLRFLENDVEIFRFSAGAFMVSGNFVPFLSETQSIGDGIRKWLDGYFSRKVTAYQFQGNGPIPFTGNSINVLLYYVNGVAGVDGSFTTADGKTVTVNKGIITSIV